MKEYAFVVEPDSASYIEHFNDKLQIIAVEGKPIVYSLTSADKAKDSMYMKRYVSTFSYKNVQVEYSNSNGFFTKVELNNEPELRFIKSFEILQNVKDLKSFTFITKFTGIRLDNDSVKTFFDTLNLHRRK